VLKEEKSRVLDFLFYVPVTRSYDFESWYKTTGYLKSKTDVPFIERTKFNKKVECLKMVFSKEYPLMGRYYYLFGGVSLASKNDIMNKLRKKPAVTAVSAKSKQPTDPATAKKLALREKGKKPGQSPQDKPRSAGTPLPTTTAQPKFTSVSKMTDKDNKLELDYKIKDVSYGKLSAEKKTDTVKLRWHKGTSIVLNEFLNNLVAVQDKRLPGYKDDTLFSQVPGVESVIKVTQWKTYLVKLKNLDDKWVCLNLNEQEKNVKYSAKSSGTDIDSDIFYARLITESEKIKIVKQ
jgi:hypothetical protein